MIKIVITTTSFGKYDRKPLKLSEGKDLGSLINRKRYGIRNNY